MKIIKSREASGPWPKTWRGDFNDLALAFNAAVKRRWEPGECFRLIDLGPCFNYKDYLTLCARIRKAGWGLLATELPTWRKKKGKPDFFHAKMSVELPETGARRDPPGFIRIPIEKALGGRKKR